MTGVPDPSTPAERPCDVLTERSVVLLQNRAVVSLSQWLLAAHELARTTERQLVLVTPEHSMLTLSVVRLVDQFGGRWAVDAGDETYDGRTGRVLRWVDGAFEATDELHPSFAPTADDTWGLHVVAETLHPYDDEPRMGRLTEAAFDAAGLGPVTGVGVAEPVESRWSLDHVNGVARDNSPRPAMLTAVSPGADGLVASVPAAHGVVEATEVLGPVGETGVPTPAAFAGAMLAAGAGLAVLGHRRAVAGRFAPSRVTGPTVPAVLVVARSRVPTLGDAELLETGGAGSRLVEQPVPALVVTYDAGTPGPLDDARADVVRRHRASLATLASYDVGAVGPTLR